MSGDKRSDIDKGGDRVKADAETADDLEELDSEDSNDSDQEQAQETTDESADEFLKFLLPQSMSSEEALAGSRKYVAYTVKLPSEQLAALQLIWLELKRLYGTHSPDKSGIIQQAITEWLKRWDGPDKQQLLRQLLEIRQNTRKRQYKKS